jgi:hypothetical protein
MPQQNKNKSSGNRNAMSAPDGPTAVQGSICSQGSTQSKVHWPKHGSQGTHPRYGKLLEDLQNNYLMGQNNYPTNLTEAYNLVVNWRQDPQNMVHYGAGPNDGVVFAHHTKEGKEEVPVATNQTRTTSPVSIVTSVDITIPSVQRRELGMKKKITQAGEQVCW